MVTPKRTRFGRTKVRRTTGCEYILLGVDAVPYVTRSGRRENTMAEPVGIETVFE